MSTSIGISGDADALARRLSPLVQMELASIGAIESAGPREAHHGYTILFQDAKQGKQANVEQMNTLLRLAGKRPVESSGALGPVLHLQTMVLQRANLTALLAAMRLVEETLVASYRDAIPSLQGLERKSMEQVLTRATKHWLVLVAHVGQRKEGDSSHADVLPFPLSAYFASEEDRVCMRCLFDRPGERPALEKSNPYTYLCSACHDETVVEFPPDLRTQMPAWTDEAHRDRVLQKALGRPLKLSAIKEVQSVLAGLPPQIPTPAASNVGVSPRAVPSQPRRAAPPASDVDLPADGAAPDELAYTDLLFDFRSVRQNW